MSDLTEKEVYTRMIESIRTAAGCAQQLAHLRGEMRWLAVRNALEQAIERITLLAIRKAA